MGPQLYILSLLFSLGGGKKKTDHGCSSTYFQPTIEPQVTQVISATTCKPVISSLSCASPTLTLILACLISVIANTTLINCLHFPQQIRTPVPSLERLFFSFQCKQVVCVSSCYLGNDIAVGRQRRRTLCARKQRLVLIGQHQVLARHRPWARGGSRGGRSHSYCGGHDTDVGSVMPVPIPIPIPISALGADVSLLHEEL